MSKSALAIQLSKLKRFSRPKTQYEQYSTPSEAAASMLWDAYMKGHIKGKTIIDLGSGTGILGIGALLLGAKQVTFIDIDPDNDEELKANLEAADIHGRYEITHADATQPIETTADLVITNPPFGTKEKHADTQFLDTATQLAPEIYTMHKSTTDEHIQQHMKGKGYQAVDSFRFTFDLPPTLPQHVKNHHHVAITCWHFTAQDL